MKKKKINKTFQIEFFLKRYGSISRMTAISHFECFDLPDVIRRINKKNRMSAIKNSRKAVIYSPVPGSEPNTKYRKQ